MRRLLLFALVPAAFAQPKWVSIATPADAYQYFLYAGEKRIEETQFTSTNPHPAPAFTYRFVAGGSRRGVCQLKDRDGVYWYSPDGTHLNGTFAVTNATEFNVSALQSGMRGFGATAHFSGSARRAGALEILYFTDRACSDGGVEYGFSRDLATDSLLVYWSTYANCGNDAASLCRRTNDPSLGKNFSNVQQENGGPHPDHGFRIYGLNFSVAHTYRIFIDHHSLRIEVWNQGKLAQCSESEGGLRAPCSVVHRVEPWFPIDRIRAGYIVAGTQNTGEADVAEGSALEVSDILVLK